MKVLIVSSKTSGELSPFVKEQMDSLSSIGIHCSLFPITRKGLRGYWVHYALLKKVIRKERPDLIHAHYGLSGLLANLQRKVPVITTFHGSDVNNKKVRWISHITAYLSSHNIYVTEQLKQLARNDHGTVIPCGVDISIFHPRSMSEAKKKMNLDPAKVYVLFCSRFDNPVKNAKLAQEALKLVQSRLPMKIELLELKQFTRQQVNHLLNASHCLLMTSFSEGSPQVVKEALAANRPVVSTAVGSVRGLILGVAGCKLVDPSPEAVSRGIEESIHYSMRYGANQGRLKVKAKLLDLEQTAFRIKKVYNHVLSAVHTKQQTL